MGRRNGIRGLLITAAFLCCVIGVHAGCANDPYSQRRIALRRAHIQQTIQGIDDHEAGAAGRLQHQTQRMRDWHRADEKIFQERMRMAGNNIW